MTSRIVNGYTKALELTNLFTLGYVEHALVKTKKTLDGIHNFLSQEDTSPYAAQGNVAQIAENYRNEIKDAVALGDKSLDILDNITRVAKNATTSAYDHFSNFENILEEQKGYHKERVDREGTPENTYDGSRKAGEISEEKFNKAAPFGSAYGQPPVKELSNYGLFGEIMADIMDVESSYPTSKNQYYTPKK